MQEWSQLYSVTGGSAATLLGLLFVAVMLVSLLAIFPSLSVSELGYGTLGVTALRGLWALVRPYWAATKPYEAGSRLQSLRQQLSSLAGFALLIYAAARMALGLGDNRTMFAIATVALLVSATTVAWRLLLRIAAESRPANSD
jgi:hypothetical protein